jgi:hypothetical protein
VHRIGDASSSPTPLLSSLGDNPGQIASNLEALGVRATPRDPGGCAIAVFLHAVLAGEPAIASIKVTDNKVLLGPARPCARSVGVRLSGPLRRFVSSFDAELFPALVRGEGDHSTRVPADDGSLGS